jgi:hypothetical protein
MDNNWKFDFLKEGAPLTRLVLEKSKVASHVPTSPQVFQDMKVDVSRDIISNKLLFNLQSYIWRHKVGENNLRVKVDEWIRIDHHLPLLAIVSGAIETSAIGVFFSSPTLAFIIAIVGFILLFVGLLFFPRKVRVQEYFTIHNNYYNTFPGNTYIYPDYLGKAITQVETFVKEDE